MSDSDALETVLLAINLSLQEMRDAISSLRMDLNQGFAKLDRLNRRLLDIEGTSDQHDERITDLESTPGFWEAVEKARGERDR
jgi:uncharacterized coiled-coil protein SlyX